MLLPFLILLVHRFYSSVALSNSQWLLSPSLCRTEVPIAPQGVPYPCWHPWLQLLGCQQDLLVFLSSSLGLYRHVWDNFWVPVLTVPWPGSMGLGWGCGGCPWCWGSCVAPHHCPEGRWIVAGQGAWVAAVQSRGCVPLQATALLSSPLRLKSCLPFFKAWI